MDPLLQQPAASLGSRHENPCYGVCFSSLPCAENGGSLQASHSLHPPTRKGGSASGVPERKSIRRSSNPVTLGKTDPTNRSTASSEMNIFRWRRVIFLSRPIFAPQQTPELSAAEETRHKLDTRRSNARFRLCNHRPLCTRPAELRHKFLARDP
jgi:hypothetical protein